LLHDSVPTKLQGAVKNGFKIVIFTNQGGISKGKTDKGDWQCKVDAVQKALGVPIQVFAATESDYYRKPSVGMWETMIKHYNGGAEVDLASSTYVGDAAGREKSGARKKDFSNSDHKFAKNVGLKFETPEMYFHGQKETLPSFEFEPSSLKSNTTLFKNVSQDQQKKAS